MNLRTVLSILLAITSLALSPPLHAEVTLQWTSFPIAWNGITGHESAAELEGLRKAGQPATWADHMVQQFTSEYPNVKIEYRRIGWDQADALKVQLAAGVGPDVFYVYPALLGQLASEGLLTPIDRYLTAGDKQELLPPTLQLGLYNGRYYLWPWFVVPEGSWLINKSLFLNAGAQNLLPREPDYRWTLDNFLAAARAVTRRDQAKPVFALNLAASFGAQNGVDAWPLWSFLYATGGDLFDTGTASVTPPLRDRIEAAYDLFRRLTFEYQVSGPGDFNQGNVAIAYGLGNQIYRQLTSVYGAIDKAPFEVMLALPPAAAGHSPGVPGGIGGWVVSKYASGEKLEWAMRFARFLTEKEQQLTLGIGLPVRRTAISDYVRENPLAQFDAIAAQHLKPYSAHPQFLKIADAWLQAGRKVIQGEWSPRQAADDYTRRANAILAER